MLFINVSNHLKNDYKKHIRSVSSEEIIKNLHTILKSGVKSGRNINM